MKPKIFVAALLLIFSATNAFAYGNYSNFPAIREVSITASFQKILVDKNIQLVLIQNPGKSTITIAGDEKKVQDVEIIIINNQLTIRLKKNMSTKEITVYVPVKNLSFLKLASGASVSGEGALKFDDLTVLVNTDSQVNLKAIGNITLESTYNCELVYERNKRSKIRVSKNF